MWKTPFSLRPVHKLQLASSTADITHITSSSQARCRFFTPNSSKSGLANRTPAFSLLRGGEPSVTQFWGVFIGASSAREHSTRAAQAQPFFVLSKLYSHQASMPPMKSIKKMTIQSIIWCRLVGTTMLTWDRTLLKIMGLKYSLWARNRFGRCHSLQQLWGGWSRENHLYLYPYIMLNVPPILVVEYEGCSISIIIRVRVI